VGALCEVWHQCDEESLSPWNRCVPVERAQGHSWGTARCVEVALKKPTREEWREERYKVTHVPTEFWMSRLQGRPEPALRRMFDDAGEYELDDLISMGTRLLKEQWLLEGGA
jgi:hypothetical protein